MQKRLCFNCRKPGHTKSQCPEPGGGLHDPSVWRGPVRDTAAAVKEESVENNERAVKRTRRGTTRTVDTAALTCEFGWATFESEGALELAAPIADVSKRAQLQLVRDLRRAHRPGQVLLVRNDQQRGWAVRNAIPPLSEIGLLLYFF